MSLSREPQPASMTAESASAVGMMIAFVRRVVLSRRGESCMGRILHFTVFGDACAACEYRRVYNGCIRETER
ncbi:hypothetical protein GCM10027167_55440 [Nocardia heshunensis]